MKKILPLLAVFLFISPHSWAQNIPAMVIVLEAPLLAQPDWRAPVLQNKRKGERVTLTAGQIPRADYERGAAEHHLRRNAEASSKHPDFWETFDRNGTRAYIPKKYVKVIFTDERELLTSASPFGKDPTDYRLSEPLPDEYPFYKGERRRAVVNILYGPSVKANYAYSESFQREEYKAHRGVQLMYLKSVSYDPLERFFFGGLLQISADQTLITFDNDNRAQEERAVFGIGPYLAYDVYRDRKNIFTLGGGLNLQWNRHLISAVSRAGNFEERLFNGLSLRPKLQANYQRREVFPHINFVAGVEIESNLPYGLEASSAPQLPNYWNPNNDTIDVPMGAHFALLIGLTATY